MSGVGKSYYGNRLSSILSLPFFDTDDIIVSKFGSIDKIFDESGEEAFRDIETEVLRKVLQVNDGIISTGGGIVEREANRELLKREKVVFLYSSVTYLYNNIVKDHINRPMLDDEDLLGSINKLYKKRKSSYEELAYKSIDVEKTSEEEVILYFKSIKNIL